MDIRDYRGDGQPMDLGDTIIHQCPCGSNMFRVVVTFEDFEIATYSLDMECIECSTRAKAPTPLDRPHQ